MEKRKFGWPLLLIAIGVIFLLKNLGFIDLDFYELLFSWPMILVAIGVVQLIDRSYVSGFILLFLGGVFMLPRLDIIHYDAMRVFWPIILIVIGVALLFRRLSISSSAGRYRVSAASDVSAGTSSDGFIRIDTSFSGNKTTCTEPVFRGGILRSIFGGIDLDLRNTRLDASEVFIDLDCSFAGITLRVPPTWRIDSRLSTTFGGFEDKRPHLPPEALDTTHVVILRGTAVFGGIEIK